MIDWNFHKFVLGLIFSNTRYMLSSVFVFSSTMILLLYAGQFLFFEPFLTFHIPKNMMLNFITMAGMSLLIGLVTSMALYQATHTKNNLKKTGAGLIGSIFGLGSGICVSCGSVGLSLVTLFGSTGIAALSFLNVYDTQIRLGTMGMLVLVYFLTVHNIGKKCDVQKPSTGKS